MSETVVRASEVEAPLQKLKQKMDAEQQPVSGRGGRALAAFSLLLVIMMAAAIAAGVYWLWPQWQSMQQAQQQIAVLQQDQQQSIEQAQQRQQTLMQTQMDAMQRLEQGISQRQQELATQNQLQLQTIKQMLAQRDSAPPRHWRLSEVDYLLQLAANKIWLEQDVTTALALLTSADEKLAALDDPSMLLIRQAINEDRKQLQAVVKPDLSQLHIQLQSLRKQSMLLPLKQQETAALPTPPVADAELKNWRNTLNYYWQNTWNKLFQVRSAVPEDYFSLTTEQQLMLRVSLNQQLVLAELAIMQQQPQVYHSALQQASDQVQRYFSSDDADVQQLSADLAALAAVDVSLPEIKPLTSLAQLQQYQQQLTENAL